MEDTLISLLKDDYRTEFRGQIPQEGIETFLNQPFTLKAVRRMAEESDETTNLCECELHGRKMNAEWTALGDESGWLQNITYEVYLTENDDVWVNLLD